MERHHNIVTFGALERGTKGQAIPASIVKYVEMVHYSASGRPVGEIASAEPFEFSLPNDAVKASCRLHFMGHYKEPYLDLKVIHE
jgi:hypothetical protein